MSPAFTGSPKPDYGRAHDSQLPYTEMFLQKRHGNAPDNSRSETEVELVLRPLRLLSVTLSGAPDWCPTRLSVVATI